MPDEAPLALQLFNASLHLRGLLAGSPSELSRFLHFCMTNAPLSRAQLMQDLFVIFMTRNKRSGYFVEFGAADGVFISNTFLLETQCGWTGILAEPARGWHDALKKNRRARIDTRCVWSKSGERLEFHEAVEGVYSTLDRYTAEGGHEQNRVTRNKYQVETVSLNDLLASHGAPPQIDYLSIDTEGSEYEILKAFDFGRYDISILTVEHNESEDLRQSIFALLSSQGYRRVFEPISQWEDWYVKGTLGAR